MKKQIVFAFLTVLISLSVLANGCAAPVSVSGNQNAVKSGLDLLKSKGIKEDSAGMLILKRYNSYIEEISKGNAFSKYIEDRTPPVHDFRAFSNMIYKDSINRIVNNTIEGKDAFEGFTGLFERAYISETDHAIDSYIIYLPRNYNPEKAYPLIVFLHGWGEAAYLPMNISAHANFLNACEKHEVIMIAPNGKHHIPSVTSYENAGEKDVLQVLQITQKAYNIDKTRIYLTGLSMGGYGTWHIGTKYNRLFAAIAPMSGYGTQKLAKERGWGYEPVDVSLLKDTPAYVWHGDCDDMIPVTESRELVNRMRELGYKVDYEELKGVGHGAADFACDGDKIITWFLQYSKE